MAALKNKLGITDSTELAKEEERISKRRAAELFESGLLDTLRPGSYSTLKTIHKHLFSDIYEFAGQTRTVNLAKGNFRFAPVMYLDAALESIENMPQSTFDEIIEKYVKMNIAHPFREGNGRTARILANLMVRKQGYAGLRFDKIHFRDYVVAVQRVSEKNYLPMQRIIETIF